MLSASLATELTHFSQLLCQPINRWEGFDLSRAEASPGALREQILYAGWVVAALGTHASADPDQRTLAAEALRSALERLIQRRVWAAWAGTIEQAGELADPVATGYASYSGALVTVLGLAAALGATPYASHPFTLRWSSERAFSYTHSRVLRTLAAQMRADYGGAIPCTSTTTTPTAMALVLWGFYLGADVIESEHTSAGARWQQTLRGQLALRGPRLPGRGALAASYHLRRRRATLLSDPLTDAASLALLAPLEPELTRELAVRHWPAVAQPERVNSTAVLAFSALLARAFAEDARADELSRVAASRADSSDLWLRAILTLTACGGLTINPVPPHQTTADG